MQRLFFFSLFGGREVSVRATTTTTKVERREESDYLTFFLFHRFKKKYTPRTKNQRRPGFRKSGKSHRDPERCGRDQEVHPKTNRDGDYSSYSDVFR